MLFPKQAKTVSSKSPITSLRFQKNTPLPKLKQIQIRDPQSTQQVSGEFDIKKMMVKLAN